MVGQNNDEAAQKHLPLEVKRRHFLKGIGFIGADAGDTTTALSTSLGTGEETLNT
ncbi:hypothetical protein [Nostoc sp. CHAB 5715]|uniref:hypothetical protein n=1 Tax=Nostoc sp. CHAB 5715 TaxID=2780400 RepID=UPI001E3221B5|nr:hypothetical protein [Nostoc sp. CHAB 5715]MCC5626537.1 hypothetical protein [Nostoc sp. CHAB 5715]